MSDALKDVDAVRKYFKACTDDDEKGKKLGRDQVQREAALRMIVSDWVAHHRVQGGYRTPTAFELDGLVQRFGMGS